MTDTIEREKSSRDIEVHLEQRNFFISRLFELENFCTTALVTLSVVISGMWSYFQDDERIFVLVAGAVGVSMVSIIVAFRGRSILAQIAHHDCILRERCGELALRDYEVRVWPMKKRKQNWIDGYRLIVSLAEQALFPSITIAILLFALAPLLFALAAVAPLMGWKVR